MFAEPGFAREVAGGRAVDGPFGEDLAKRDALCGRERLVENVRIAVERPVERAQKQIQRLVVRGRRDLPERELRLLVNGFGERQPRAQRGELRRRRQRGERADFFLHEKSVMIVPNGCMAARIIQKSALRACGMLMSTIRMIQPKRAKLM